MSNTLLNPSVIAKEALRQLKNNCVMGNLVFRGYEDEFRQTNRGWKVGSSIDVKVPVYFRTHHARDITSAKVDLREEKVNFAIDRWVGVAWTLNAEEMTLNMDKFSQRFLQPAMQAIANDIDSYILALYTNICNQVGTPGTTPTDYLTYALAAARLTDHSVPLQDRHCVISPTARAYLSDHIKGINNPGIAQKTIEDAYLGPVAGFKMYETQNIPNHTVGTWGGGTVLVDDTLSEGDVSFNLDQNGTGSALTVKAGDIFTCASSYACNPISGAKLPYLRQFVMTADGTFADVGGGDYSLTNTAIPGTDPWNIYSQSATSQYLPYQNVYTLPQNNDSVAVSGTSGQIYPVNLAFHRDAMGLIMVPIDLPASMEWKAVESYDGYTIAVSRYTDGDTLTETIRLDALLGRRVLNPFMACRIAG